MISIIRSGAIKNSFTLDDEYNITYSSNDMDDTISMLESSIEDWFEISDRGLIDISAGDSKFKITMIGKSKYNIEYDSIKHSSIDIDAMITLIRSKVSKDVNDIVVEFTVKPVVEEESKCKCSIRKYIYDMIDIERSKQRGMWGDAFDAKNTLNDWAAYICRYSGNLTRMTVRNEIREQLVKVAALAVAAIEAIDNNDGLPPRHYDD